MAGQSGGERVIDLEQCVRKLKNNKTGGSDALVGELLYGGQER